MPRVGNEYVYAAGRQVARRHPVIDQAEVLRRTGFSVTTLRRRMADRGFPRPVYVDYNAPRWVEEAVDKWLACHLPGRAETIGGK